MSRPDTQGRSQIRGRRPGCIDAFSEHSERDSLLQGEHLLLLVLVVVHLRTVGELVVPGLEHTGGTEDTLESQSHADTSKAAACVFAAHAAPGSARHLRIISCFSLPLFEVHHGTQPAIHLFTAYENITEGAISRLGGKLVGICILCGYGPC